MENVKFAPVHTLILHDVHQTRRDDSREKLTV